MGRVALVTGGTRGIGAATAKALKKAGYDVSVNYGGNEEAAKAFNKETKIPVFKWDVGDYTARESGTVNVENKIPPIETTMPVSRAMVGRLGEAEEVARCVVFLAADEAAWITG